MIYSLQPTPDPAEQRDSDVLHSGKEVSVIGKQQL